MNAIESAKAARLRYVSDDMPGIRREKRGEHFAYVAPDGASIEDEDELARIKALAIPPAYNDVWICPLANGHIQATARDARGRKQYRYHKRWREVRDENKYERMAAFAQALPAMRKKLERDLALPGLPRNKVMATIVQLLTSTAIRVGNDEYARDNNSFGLTTLRNTHARVRGATVRFSFRGKSGVRHAVDLHDRRIARIVRQCQDLPGQRLFEYLDDDGSTQSVDSSDVNEYIRELAGDDFSAKDFRTWAGTVTCAMLLADETLEQASERKQRVVDVIKEVARRLGNTPAICRKCYVHPAIVDAYLEQGRLGTGSLAEQRGLDADERLVLAILKERSPANEVKRTLRGLQQSLRERKKRTA
ncbi:MAG TPA: hypothetical protein VGR69_01155 [Candidatus Rubrimentiphilum sp.]|nr:hypothetical protein [Candidatus Rubrimentiphilum sp.]